MNKSLKEEMRTIYRPEENLAIPPEYPPNDNPTQRDRN